MQSAALHQRWRETKKFCPVLAVYWGCSWSSRLGTLIDPLIRKPMCLPCSHECLTTGWKHQCPCWDNRTLTSESQAYKFVAQPSPLLPLVLLAFPCSCTNCCSPIRLIDQIDWSDWLIRLIDWSLIDQIDWLIRLIDWSLIDQIDWLIIDWSDWSAGTRPLPLSKCHRWIE